MEVDPARELEKKIRALKKKTKQCEEIKAKEAAGGDINDEQKEKLGRLPEFQSDIAAAEKALAALSL